MPYKNPKDKKKYRKEWHRENYYKYAEEHRRKVARRRKKLRKFLSDYKENSKCEICEEDTVCCLEFHHVDGAKEIDISKAPAYGWSIERILDEIAKCRILCSNCHKKVHAGVV